MILTSWTKLLLFLSFLLVITILSIPNDSKLGVIYFKSYNYEKALEYFDQAKTVNNQSPTILNKLKEYFLIQGDINKALISQKKITEILPKNIQHLQELAKLYNWNNMPYQNLKAREKIAQLQPSHLRMKSYLSIAQGYRWLKKYQDADRIALIIGESNNTENLRQNLNYYLATKNIQMAVKTLEKLEKLEPGNLNNRIYLAQAYTLKNNLTKAIENYMIVVGQDLKYSQSLYKTNFLEINKKKICNILI